MKEADDVARRMIAAQWQRVAEFVADPAHKSSHKFESLIPVAREDPILGRLSPHAGVNGLSFSRCTDAPHYTDIVFGAYAANDYAVCVTDGRGSYMAQHQREIGRGDAETAVRIAREFLPPDYPAAIHGSAKDLDLENDPTALKLREALRNVTFLDPFKKQR